VILAKGILAKASQAFAWKLNPNANAKKNVVRIFFIFLLEREIFFKY